MKLAVLFLSVLFIFAFLGCTDSNISNPKSLKKSYSLLKLPGRAANLSIENAITVSQDIDGSTGGTLSLADSYQGMNGEVFFDMELVIPPGLFSGVQTVTVTLDGEYATFKFAPDLTEQQVTPILFSCAFSGLNLSRGETYDFIYLDVNNNMQPCNYHSINVDVEAGTASVVDAQIINYEPDSRYGWATITEPDPDE